MFKSDFSNEILLKETKEIIYGKYLSNILYPFIKWMLDDINEKNIKTVYFLSRDAYIFKEIAKIICYKYNYNIDIKYLYCSRISLRVPLFWKISKIEQMNYIFSMSANISLNKILKRTTLPNNCIDIICNELNICKVDRNKLLSKSEVNLYRKKFEENKTFNNAIENISKEKYKNCIGYLKQEGLFSKDKFAIVDSGWTGSIQKNISCLIDNDVYAGYYYGLFEIPDFSKEKMYYSYYFSPKKDILKKVFFNNNVFEYLCSAPHPMTISYIKQDNIYHPVFEKEHIDYYDTKKNIGITLKYIKKILNEEKNFKLKDKKILRKIMIFPNKKTVNFFRNSFFSDDMNEFDDSKLMSELSIGEIKKNFVLGKILGKINGVYIKESLWLEGNISLQKNKYFLIARYIFYKLIKYTKQSILNVVKGIICK